jgi:hypothetical protein
MALRIEENEPSGGGNQRPRLEAWIVGSLLLFALVIGLGLVIGEGMIHRAPADLVEPEAPAVAPPDPMEPPALMALEAFFEAPDLASKVLLVRDSRRVRPMMEDFHEKRSHEFPSLARVSPGRVAHFGGTPMVLFEVEPFSGPRYPVAVVWDGNRFAVDWESLTAYGTMDWSEFVETRPESPQTLRVYIKNTLETGKPPGTPLNAICFLVEDRSDPQPLIATADSKVAALLGPLVENQRAPVTLEIAWKPISPGGISFPKILRLVSPKWSP